VHVESLNFDDNQIEQLSSSGSWNGARFYNSTSWINLGTLGFDLSEDGQGGIKAKIFDVEGPLQLQLDSQFNLTGDYLTQGQIQLRPSAPKEIADLLNNYTNVSREVQEVLLLFVESKGRDTYSVRWVNPE
jgi:general secretion pathway protein N